jgi:hypothetical protein
MGYGQHSGRSHYADTDRGDKRFDDYESCVRGWLSGEHHSGRAGGSRMYFTGATLYSYGSHYPMARIVLGKGGAQGVLVNCDSNSVTTNRHMTLVRRIVDYAFDRARIFEVPTEVLQSWDRELHLAANHNLVGYRAEAARLRFLESATARSRKEELIRSAMWHLREANRYADFFGIERPFANTDDPEAVRLALALNGSDLLLIALNEAIGRNAKARETRIKNFASILITGQKGKVK